MPYKAIPASRSIFMLLMCDMYCRISGIGAKQRYDDRELFSSYSVVRFSVDYMSYEYSMRSFFLF